MEDYRFIYAVASGLHYGYIQRLCRRDFSGVVYVVKSSAFGERLKDSHALGL
jgi:hypothetical protein